jgi:hypothetical protein
MRILITNLLATAVLLFGATSASAFAVNMALRPGGNDPNALNPGDSVVVDFFADFDQPNTQLFAFSVFSNDPGISYDDVASAALPIIYPAPSYGANVATGAGPGYILYMAGMPPAALYPLQNPSQLWIAPPPGQGQVNVNYSSPAVNSIGADTGSNVWVASLVFTATESGTLTLSVSNTTSILRVNNVVLDPSTVSVSEPIALTVVPEPTTAALIGLGILGLAVAGRRNRR